MDTRWITFDCFGTLVDWNAGFAGILTPLAGARTAELVRAYHKFERTLEAERPHKLYKEVLVSGLLRAAREIDLPLSQARALELPKSWGQMPVFPDVEDMLAGLRAMGCRLAVLTNCDDDLFAETQRCFRQPFDRVVTAQRVEDYKPTPTHFEFFARSSGLRREDWIHVACSWFHDIAPAGKLGIRSVWLDRDRTGEDPMRASAHVHSAAEVCSAIGGLFGRPAER